MPALSQRHTHQAPRRSRRAPNGVWVVALAFLVWLSGCGFDGLVDSPSAPSGAPLNTESTVSANSTAANSTAAASGGTPPAAPAPAASTALDLNESDNQSERTTGAPPISTSAPLNLADAAAQVRQTSALVPLSADATDSIDSSDPVGFSFPSLGVDAATVRAVGVEPNGELEVPPESEVGWYRYSPAPGEAGSSVLAAHVNYDGRDGVFRYLTEAKVGAAFSVQYADGTSRDFVVSEVAQYDKAGLPNDRIFARAGVREVALITCGGTFDYDARSYEDNVVVFGVPA